MSYYIKANCLPFRIALVAICIKTDFFWRKFGVVFEGGATMATNHNDRILHSIVYLQVAIISQALIFTTRSHSFFFMERPSVALFCAFCIAQLISTIIAVYGDWGFTDIHGISGGWVGIVWVWVSSSRCARVPLVLTLPCRTLSGSCPSTGSSLR